MIWLLMSLVRDRLGHAETNFPITMISGFLWNLLYALSCAEPHCNAVRSDYPCLRIQSTVRFVCEHGCLHSKLASGRAGI